MAKLSDEEEQNFKHNLTSRTETLDGEESESSLSHTIKSVDTLRKSRPGETWEQLEARDKVRLKILERVEYPFIRVLLSWRGTCLAAIFADSMAWIPLTIYGILRVMVHLRQDVDLLPPTFTDAFGSIDILGGFLSFFLVLFVNQTNTRFFDMYALSRACSGRIQDVAQLAGARLPKDVAGRMIRYMNAAHIAGYVALGGPYTKKNFFDHFNKKHGLLQPEEFDRLEELQGMNMDGGSDIFKELCVWTNKEVAAAQAAGYIDSFEATTMQLKICDLRAHMDGIHDTCFQPPHFFYIHFLCILSALYLPLFAIETAASVNLGTDAVHIGMEILSGVIVVLQCIFVVGLRLLGQKMIDPYGNDYEDLSVITFVTVTLKITGIMLSASDQGSLDSVTESRILHTHARQAKPASKLL